MLWKNYGKSYGISFPGICTNPVLLTKRMNKILQTDMIAVLSWETKTEDVH